MSPTPGVFPWWYPHKTHAAWSRIRERGAARFILVNGLAWYGGLMFVVMGLLLPMAGNGWRLPADWNLALAAVVWATAGLAWGALTWYFSEINFRKYSARNGAQQS
ncbi:MAG: hypothetical protein M3Q11_09255 [Pseudomonadota bacterium]|nr:hypothetical protein [Pseudomonadota bacterium]